MENRVNFRIQEALATISDDALGDRDLASSDVGQSQRFPAELRACDERVPVPISRRMSETTSVIDVCIAGTGSYVPERILTNEELAARVDTSDEWIVTRTGIKERRIAAEGEFTSHMASKAARNALEQAGLAAEDIELIVVATITPDTPTPATACHVQTATRRDQGRGL